MGIDINKIDFSQADYDQFQLRLEENLRILEQLLAQPEFGRGTASLGAEMEMYIVDTQGKPLYANQEVLEQANDPALTLELNRYNLEYNLPPFNFDQTPFAATEQAIVQSLGHLRTAVAQHNGQVVPIGILPTLSKADFGGHCVTDRVRYHALRKQLIQRRGETFQIDINGENPLRMEMGDITLEGANTSFQVHYRVDPEVYADTFNAIQLMTPLAVAMAANSPTLFGHSLWQETRIPLFKQSIDTRHLDRYSWNQPARVSFGQGWARRGPGELFREVVGLYPPLLPICSECSSTEELAAGKMPTLSEIRLHQSTVWSWNRPIYDDLAGGHLRIEMRALPSGPTAVDMVANAAFLIGLAEGVREQINDILPALPFQIAEYNFYRAAQYAMDAKLIWPRPHKSGYAEQPLCDIVREMLPLAHQGLRSVGIDKIEANHYLGVIEERLDSRQNGATWQQHSLAKLKQEMPADRALNQLLDTYISHSSANVPVAQWPL